MDNATWAWLKYVLQYATITVMGWLYMSHQKTHSKIDRVQEKLNDRISAVQDRVSSLETNVEVLKVMIRDLSEDTKEIKEGIKQLLNAKH